MKKSYITLALLAIFTIAFASCREKTTGEKVEDAVESVGEDIEDGIDEVGDAIDGGK